MASTRSRARGTIPNLRKPLSAPTMLLSISLLLLATISHVECATVDNDNDNDNNDGNNCQCTSHPDTVDLSTSTSTSTCISSSEDLLSSARSALSTAVSNSTPLLPYDSGGLPFHPSRIPPSPSSYDVCVVGAGLSGSVLAERYAEDLGKKVLVMDARTHIGGNCYDFVEPLSGIRLNLYGAHIFHTGDEQVYDYVTRRRKRRGDDSAEPPPTTTSKPTWKRYDHSVVGRLAPSLFLPIPVNINTVNGLFQTSLSSPSEMDAWLRSVQIPCPLGPHECRNAEEMALSRVGRDLFDRVFKTYTVKQWDREAKELDAEVTARIPVRNDFDDRYFGDKYQVLPEGGYTDWFAHVLGHEHIDLALGVDYFKVRGELEGRCGKTVFTGPVDRYFADAGLPPLEYRSVDFRARIERNAGYRQTHSVVNYPGPEVDYTRIVEYKHFFRQRSDYTVTVEEFGTGKGDPYYPVPDPKNRALYRRYQELAEREERERNVYFVGRLASYKYFNMDAAIRNALDAFDRMEGRSEQPDNVGEGSGSGSANVSGGGSGSGSEVRGETSTVSDSV